MAQRACEAARVAPSMAAANLRPWLEGFLLLVNAGITVLWVACYGLKMGV